jgi:histidyl-tRNA synthetase
MQFKPLKGTIDYAGGNNILREVIFTQFQQIFATHKAKETDIPAFELKHNLNNKYGQDSKLIYDLVD